MSQLRYGDMQKSTILNGTAVGGSVRMTGIALAAIFLDAAWDTNIITFQGSFDGTNWSDIYLDDANTQLQVPATAAVAGRALCINTVLDKLAAFPMIRPRSGLSPGTNQAGDTTLTFVLKS